VFKKFYAFGINLRELTVSSITLHVAFSLRELTQSQQCRYIKKLTLNEIISEFMHLMSNMEVLTRLEMRVDHHSRPLTIDFGQLVEACPATLTHLTLSRLILEYKEPTSNQTFIKCLDLSFLVLKPVLAKIVETYLCFC
jgi:hypothetical protein